VMESVHDETEGTNLSFWEHLAELRQRLVASVAALVIGFIVAWIFKEELFALVSAPVKEGLAAHGIYRLTAIETVEAIMVYLKLAFAAAIVVTIPVSLYQLWAFVKPGLVAREVRPMRRVAILAAFMFALGVIFSYRLVLPLVIDFLTGFTLGAGDVDFQVTMKSAYSTTLVFLVGFGLIFELPLVMVLLAATPLFDSRKYLKWIRYSVVIAFVIGSMLTPPDVLSQLLMAVPVCTLYVVGIGLTWMSERRRELGLEARPGIDWPLVGGVVLLTGLVAALGWPQGQPMASYLPYGARTILLSSAPTEVPGCGGLEATATSPLSESVCAVYAEGPLLLVRPEAEADAEALCGALTGGSGEVSCRAVDGIGVAGNPVLVARYGSNREERRADSDPLSLEEETLLSFFVSLQSTPREQRAYLRLTEEGGDDPGYRLHLSFGDPREAQYFVEALAEAGTEGGLPSPPGGLPQQAGGPASEALLELCAALDEMAVHVPAQEAVSIRRRVERARTLLHTGAAPEAGPAARLLRCESSPCAYAFLAPHLTRPVETEVVGRVVMLRYPQEGVSGEALRELLRGVAAAAEQ
jgi:sec-independent protein translocase protein TatC